MFRGFYALTNGLRAPNGDPFFFVPQAAGFFVLGAAGWATFGALAQVLERLERLEATSPRLKGDHSTRGALMSQLHRITINPAQSGGRPCIRGLRVRVKDVLELLAAGAIYDEILGDYPYLEAEDITAVLEFAARQSDHPVLRVA